MIPWDDFLEAGVGLSEGDQVAINHTNCTAGTDTRRRLYVKRVNDGLIVAFCHNCGDKGIYLDGYTNVNSYRKPVDSGTCIVHQAKPPMQPHDLDYRYHTWPSYAAEWVRSFSRMFKMAWSMRIGYSPSRDRVIIPFYNQRFDYEGYISRKVNPNDEYPKYLHHLKSDIDRFYATPAPSDHHPQGVELPKCIVVCEDLASGAKLYNNGVKPYVLCGGHFDIYNFTKYAGRVEVPVVVWLDNDNDVIRARSEVIQKQLSLFYAQTKIGRVANAKEPKTVQYPTIKAILEEALRV